MDDGFELQPEHLFSPELWYRWRAAQRSRGVAPQDLAARVVALGSDIAYLRHAILLEIAEQIEEMLPSLKRCLTSTYPAIRAYAMAVLVHTEAKTRLRAAPEDLERVNPAVDILEECLRTLRASGERSDFALEAEVVILYNLSSLHSLMRNYPRAMQDAAQAIYLSLPLKALSLTNAVRMSYAFAALHLGRTQDALQEYETIGAGSTNPLQRHYAALNCCLIHLMHGELRSAWKVIDGLSAEYQDAAPTRVTRQHVAAIAGMLGPDEEIVTCPQGVYDILNPALRLLVQQASNGKKAELGEVLDLLRNWHPKSQLDDATASWLQTTALLRLDRPYLAAQRIHRVTPLYPLAELLVLGAKIEIGLHHDGVETEPLGELCGRVHLLFSRLPSQEARDGLAATLALWHPAAAAFVAMSPYSVPELVDAAMPAVFMDGRPIQVHGKAVPSRLPFLQLSLEAFGVDASVARDQSVERERMARALNIRWGSGHRMLPVVPPALLIFHYLRLAERDPREAPLWRRAAQELARSHGTLPATSGGNLRAQRTALEGALQLLLDQQINTRQFLEVTRSLNKGRKAA